MSSNYSIYGYDWSKDGASTRVNSGFVTLSPFVDYPNDEQGIEFNLRLLDRLYGGPHFKVADGSMILRSQQSIREDLTVEGRP
jgi:hypothetical protein